MSEAWWRLEWFFRRILQRLGLKQVVVCRMCGREVAWDYMGHHIRHWHTEHWDEWKEWEEQGGRL